MDNKKLEYLIHCGVEFSKKNQTHKALSIFLEALKLDSQNLMLLYNIARDFFVIKEFNKSIYYYSKAVSLKPDFTQAKFDLSLIYLLTGSFIDGFKMYENRISFDAYTQPLPIKYPNKPKDLKNKRILVFHEQGFGDTINFMPFTKEILKYSSDIDILVQSPLLRVIEYSYKEYNIIDKLGSNDYDYIVPLLSIPYIFKLTSFKPKKRSLSVEKEEIVEYKKKNNIKKKNLNIGICWQGIAQNTRDKYRSIDINKFYSFFNLSKNNKVKFYSLQKDIRVDDNRVLDIAVDFKDFYDTSVAIKSLDLVISVDTAIVHLCGALGVKTCLLLPYLSDFRWGLNSSKSLFYKSVTIFRQEAVNQWQKPIDLVKKIIYKKLDIKDVVLFRSYTGSEDKPMMIRIGDFMAYMIIAQYFKIIEKKYIVLALSSRLHIDFKANKLFENLFDEIYIDEKPINITTNIFDPDQSGGLWNISPKLLEQYGNKIIPNPVLNSRYCIDIFQVESQYIIFNPLITADYNTGRNMNKEFVNQFANSLYAKFKSKLIVITDVKDLIENKNINVVMSNNLYDLFYLISKSTVFIGGDTGFSHFSGLAGIENIYQLYGSTYPAINNDKYFNANIQYRKNKTKMHSYILKNNSLNTKEQDKIVKSIRKIL